MGQSRTKQLLTSIGAALVALLAFGGIAFAQSSINNTGPDSTNTITNTVAADCNVVNNNNLGFNNSNSQSAETGNATVSHNTNASGWGAYDPAVWQAQGYTYKQWQAAFNNYVKSHQASWKQNWGHISGGGGAYSGNASNSNVTNVGMTVKNMGADCGFGLPGGPGSVGHTGPGSHNSIDNSVNGAMTTNNNNNLGANNGNVQGASSGNASSKFNTSGGGAGSGGAGNGNSLGGGFNVNNLPSGSIPKPGGGSGGGGNGGSNTISNTGPDSDNSITNSTTISNTTVNNNNVGVNNTSSQSSTSGNATTSHNTTAGGSGTGSSSNTNTTNSTINIHN